MVKAGLVAFDTSHVMQFTKRCNHIEIDEEQWIDGIEIVAGLVTEPSAGNEQRASEYVEQLTGWGVKMVDSPGALLDAVDCVMVESNDADTHLPLVRPYLEAGRRVWVDKPFANTVADAEAMVELAEKHGAGLMTGSSLRYAPEVQDFASRLDELGPVRGAVAFSPSSPLNEIPALLNYGCHGVEMLYGVIRGGCERVSSIDEPAMQTVTGTWSDGRVGVALGIQQGARGYGFTAFCENGSVTAEVTTAYIYRELLKKISGFFNTGETPIPIDESVEIIKFITGAIVSAKRNGEPVEL